VGFLVAAMIMHGLTDPTTILATGGIDEITEAGGDNVFLTATGAFTLVMVPAGVILLMFVRGRVQDRGESAS
jgi:hypothetical protein